MVALPFSDRLDGARMLFPALAAYAGRADVIVLGLPRGGVPVAAELARVLRVPFDILVVRKLGFPGHAELAFGAVASGGIRVLLPEIASYIDQHEIEIVTARERAELVRREERFRGNRPFPCLDGRVVILVDDGLATGATMRAAVQAVRQRAPAKIVVAVPVAPPDTIAGLATLADQVVCPATPEPFVAIGRWYRDFRQVSDEEVVELLAAPDRHAPGSTPPVPPP